MWLGLSSVTEGLSRATVYNLPDAIFGTQLRYVMLVLGTFELVIGCICLLNAASQSSITLIAWLILNLAVYRVGLQVTGSQHPYHWISPVTKRFDISAQHADLVLGIAMVCMLTFSLGFLLLGRGASKTVAYYKISCASCGGKIEFPAHGLGQQVNCPHCSVPVILRLPTHGHSQDPTTPQQPAFTLIELLVVISIIGILASLLLPVLSKGKDRAHRLVDINNLKQQITATHLYAADHTGTLPWPNWALGDSPERPGWLYKLDTTATGPARFKVETGVFWPMLHNPKLYFCPRDGPHVPRFAERPQQISSYVMNGAVIGYNRTNFPPERLDAFHPDDIAFWETDEKYPDYFNDGSSYPWEGVSARHDLGAIHAAFGGQVEFIKLELWYLEEAKPTRNRLWCYPGSKDGR